jgi:hypothetical protein
MRALTVPVGFLLVEGSRPTLTFKLYRIPFPTLPQLLLYCDDLSEHHLRFMPNFLLHFILPEASVKGLSAFNLHRPKYFQIEFQSSQTIPSSASGTSSSFFSPRLLFR